MSYLDFYGLTRAPFHVTPDPDFLYLSPSHKEALATFLYGVARRKGILAVTGEVGVGKTTVLRSYLDQVASENIKLIYLFNANMTFGDLVRTLCHELDCSKQPEHDSDFLNELQHALVREYREGRNVVLIIDEAQNIPYDTLENLRMLSNLETKTEKLMQIVLIGQPELQDKLNEHRLRQLRQRIAVRSTIVPLTPKESVEYIASRLEKCGVKDPETVFTAGALRHIVNTADGIPRVINILSDNALITGYGYQKRPIDISVVKEVAADFFGAPERNYRPWAISAAVLTMLVIFLWFFSREVPPSAMAQAATGPVANASARAPASIYETAVIHQDSEPSTNSNTGHASKKNDETRKSPAERAGIPKRKQGNRTESSGKNVSRSAALAKKKLEEKISLERSRKIQLLVQNLSKQSAQQIRSLSRQNKPLVTPSTGKPETNGPEPAMQSSSGMRSAPGSRRNTPAVADLLPDQDSSSASSDGLNAEHPPPTATNENSRIVLTRVPPAVLRTVKPVYPKSGIAARLEGTVFLKVLVTEGGQVEAVQVLRGIGGNRAFSDSAMAAVKQWKFTPGVLNGVRQKMWVTCAIAYQLKG